jgi:hypothetical protein
MLTQMVSPPTSGQETAQHRAFGRTGAPRGIGVVRVLEVVPLLALVDLDQARMLGHRVRDRVIFQIAKALGERHVVGPRDVLVAEEQHAVFEQSALISAKSVSSRATSAILTPASSAPIEHVRIDLHDFIPWALWIEGGHARSRGAGNPETPARRLEMIVANRDACCLTHRAMTWRTMPSLARASVQGPE